MTRLLGVASVICTSLLFASGARAATFTVTDTADAPLQSSTGKTCVSSDGGKCTLRAAVQAADNNPGANSIALHAGHYKLTIDSTGTTPDSDPNDPAHGDLDVVNGITLTITGAGSSTTIVDANELDRAFTVQGGAGLSLSGMNIENGNPAVESSGRGLGGAVYTDGSLRLTADVTMRLNTSLDDASGGAIFADTGATALSVVNSNFVDNSSYGDGGAIEVDGSSALAVAITATTFSDNETGAGGGGAIFDYLSGPLTVTSSHFNGNGANGSADVGGAIADLGSASDTISSSTFSDNLAGDGALFLDSSGTTPATMLSHDEFDGNRANEGGAVFWQTGSLDISSSSLVGNRAADEGGGLSTDVTTQPLTMTNATISGNYAIYGGGVEFGGLPQISFTNDTIAFNGAKDGGGLSDPSATTAGGAGVVNTIVADNAGGDCGATFKAADDHGDNLDSDSSCFGGLGVTPADRTDVDPRLNPAAPNGGLVMTDALSAGSPAIDAAKATACPSTDARGVARPQGAGCDIGAFEVSAPHITITAPGNGATYAEGRHVRAAYTCSEAALASLIASCKGPVAEGATIDTSKPGSHSFTVTVVDDQGLAATATVRYSVRAPAPPNTRITGHKVSRRSLTLKFKGSGGSGRLGFRCKLDNGKFKKCSSPKRFSRLSRGAHTVSVQAVDATGRSDPTPAKIRFRIG